MYDLLKDFQPTFAASIALCAAALAYLSAMAKVRLDKTEAAQKRASEELRLYLRTRVTLMGIRERAAKIASDLEKSENEYARAKPATLPLEWSHELDEAWDRLDLFPDITVRTLFELRRNLLEMKVEFEPTAAIDTRGEPTRRQAQLERLRTIVSLCDDLGPDLEHSIGESRANGFGDIRTSTDVERRRKVMENWRRIGRMNQRGPSEARDHLTEEPGRETRDSCQ